MKLRHPVVSSLLALLLAGSSVQATTYTFSKTSAGTAQWAAGTNWSGVPVSAVDTTLSFSGTLAASVAVVSNNDISGDFKLNVLNMIYAGPSSGTAPSVTLSGNRLEFATNVATTPTLVFNTSGTIKPTVVINNDLLLTNNLAITATTDGKLGGIISGGGNLSKSGSGTLTLSGANSYSGTTAVSGGVLDIGTIATGSLGAGGLLISGSAILQGNGTFSRGFAVSPVAGTPTAGAGQVAAGSGGFSAKGGTLTVNFGGSGTLVSLSGAANSNRFGDNFIFGTTASDSAVVVVNPLDLNGSNRVFTVNSGSGGDYAELQGAIRGTGGTGIYGFDKRGTGMLVLSGSNVYTGATTVTAGTIKFAKQASLYGSTVTSWTADNLRVASGATLAFNVGGTNEFNTTDVAALLTNLATSSSATTNGMAAGSSLGFDTTNASGASFTIANNIANTSGAAGGARGLTKLGAGTLVISGVNGYTGGTIINGNGTITVQNDQSGATGGWSIGTSSPSTSSTVNFQSGSTVVVAGSKSVQIGASSQIGSTNQNSQVLNVAGTVTNQGTLYVGREGALTINNGGDWTQNGGMSLNSFGGVALSMTVNSGGSFTYAGSTAVGINSASGNVGSPNLTIAGGAFTTAQGFQNNTSVGTGVASLVLSGGGTLKLSGDIATLTSTAGSAFNFQLGTGGGVIDTQAFSTTMSRVIGNVSGQTGALTKSGTGTLTLSGNNTYTGATQVNAGKLVINGDQSAATGAMAVNSTATLKGTGTIGGALTVAGTSGGGKQAVHAPGNGIGRQTVTNDVTYGQYSIFEWELGSNKDSAGWDDDNNSATPNVVGSRGSDFDALDITGGASDLIIDETVSTGAVFKVVLGVDFDGGSAFWLASRSWDVFSVAGLHGTQFKNFQLFNASAPTIVVDYSPYGTFSYNNTGSLGWSAVPEPASSLAGLLIGAGLLRRRRA